MANSQHVDILRQEGSGMGRKANPGRVPGLRRADLLKAAFSGADLSHADLRQANLSKALLANTSFEGANLTGANLTGEGDMETIESQYGSLGPVRFVELYPDDAVLSVTPQGSFVLDTPLGKLTPQHTTDDMRRPKVEPLQFHPNGVLKNIALETPTMVDTPLGPMTAELLTFYPNGALRRVFPLNGKLSGYWSIKEEATLTAPLTMATPAGSITALLVGVQFHPSGTLRSITLWPEETVDITTPLGKQTTRIGLAFHENGALRSFEPARVLNVPTPIGLMQAFEPDPLGIHGDLNSLSFHPDGTVAGLHTPVNTVTVTTPDGARTVYSPGRVPSLCDENVMDVTALAIAFGAGEIAFGQDPPESFPLVGHTFTVGSLLDNCLGPITYHCKD